MLNDKSMTYVTLFSSAGVGCHGFQHGRIPLYCY